MQLILHFWDKNLTLIKFKTPTSLMYNRPRNRIFTYFATEVGCTVGKFSLLSPAEYYAWRCHNRPNYYEAQILMLSDYNYPGNVSTAYNFFYLKVTIIRIIFLPKRGLQYKHSFFI